mmetsp:Transcript_44926/g.82031  ORF Transcript_44926/g.82031 Transcript_44926/m.82031 type:complete len:227 (-) Transcript_44926:751-1431(-)
MSMQVAATAVVGKRDILLGLMKVKTRVGRPTGARAAAVGLPARWQKSPSVDQIPQAQNMAQLPMVRRTRKRVDAMKAYRLDTLASQGTGRANLWAAFNILTAASLVLSIAFRRRVGAGMASIAFSAILTMCQGCARRKRSGSEPKGSGGRTEGWAKLTTRRGGRKARRTRMMMTSLMNQVETLDRAEIRYPCRRGLHPECQWAKCEEPALALDFLQGRNRTANWVN